MRRFPSFLLVAKGFTLIETIIVMVVVGIAAATISILVSNIFTHQDDNKTLQVGMKLLEECAEQVLATRRATGPGLGYGETPNCDTLGGFNGFKAPAVKSVAVTITGNFDVGTAGCTGGGPCGCPTGGSCKLVTIAVTTTAGDELFPVTLLLVGP